MPGTLVAMPPSLIGSPVAFWPVPMPHSPGFWMLLPPPAGAAVVPDDGAAVVPDDGAAVGPEDGAAVVFDDGAAVVAVDELLLLPHAPRMSMPTAATPITERFVWSPFVSWTATLRPDVPARSSAPP